MLQIRADEKDDFSIRMRVVGGIHKYKREMLNTD